MTGRFQKLPILRWGDRLVAETTVIASFLHRLSGDADQLDDDENLRHAMPISSLCLDLMTPLALLLWSEFAVPGSDLGTTAKRTLDRTQGHLAALDRTLARAGSRPVMVADCILWDQIDCAGRVFGRTLDLEATPTLVRFHRECRGREVFEQLLHDKPCPITARPGEARCIARIHELVASG